MRIATVIGLLIVAIALFFGKRRGHLDNDTQKLFVDIATIVAGLGAVIAIVVPFDTPNEPNAIPTPSIEIAIPSSETPVRVASIAPTTTSGPTNTGTDGPLPTLTISPTPTLSPTPTRTPAPTVPIPAGIQVVATRVAEEDGMIQVYVSEGHFLMGSVPEDREAYDNEKPQRSIYLNAFWIDQVEVTNGMYAACVAAGKCSPLLSNGSSTRDSYFNDPQYSHYPIIEVSWDDADTYCRWVGRRLPTEAEWEKAARGTDGRTYPWGNDTPTVYLLNFNQHIGDTTEVGAYSSGASPYGALDMAGNVWEWVADWYDEEYYSNSSENQNPRGPTAGRVKVLRGGSWRNDDQWVRTGIRRTGGVAHRDANVGVRCAASP